MAIRKQTIKQRIETIRRLLPHRDDATGMLYAKREQLKKKYTKATMFGLFVSDENTFLLRPHVFETSREARTPAQWEAWFSDNYNADPEQPNGRPGVLYQILQGMFNRTQKHWRLYRIIGWAPNDYSGFDSPKVRSKRTKAKPQRRTHGRNRTRS